jgi:hypothetical protein
MKTKPSARPSLAHQTVTDTIEFKNGSKAIQIGFTDQQLSPHAGTATFWAFVRRCRFVELLAQCLPHPRSLSNNHLSALSKALSFIQGLLCGAEKLTHVAYLRRDPLQAELLAIERVSSQSSLSRFFGGFDSAGKNLMCFRRLWRWAMERLPSRQDGYALDLDSTRLLHEDGHQEGVQTGYTRLGTKPCLHPLLAVLTEAKLVAQFWLRPGNASCGNNVVAFFLDLWDNLPRHLRLRVVRADSGFCLPQLLDLWERLKLFYIVVERFTVPVKRLLRKEMDWQATEVPGTEVAETVHQEQNWAAPRRVILIRHRVNEKKRAGGKRLFDCPGYLFQALVTNLPASVAALAVWREYNGRAGCEGVIKELDAGFAVPKLVCRRFWATEAALSLAVMSYNLAVLFQRHLGWLQNMTVQSLRYWLFVTAGVLSHPGGKTTIKLAVPEKERDWWRRVWGKILSPVANCHAVENRPVVA